MVISYTALSGRSLSISCVAMQCVKDLDVAPGLIVVMGEGK